VVDRNGQRCCSAELGYPKATHLNATKSLKEAKKAA
jgi:hypothetical protein